MDKINHLDEGRPFTEAQEARLRECYRAAKKCE